MAEAAYDSHDSLRGVWGGSASSVPEGFAHQAMNRWFRNDANRTRPLFRNIALEFDTDADRIWFDGGNVQGAFFYNAYPSFLDSRIIVSVAGKIFTIKIVGQTGIVKVLFEGNTPNFTHAWFAQGFEWLFIQDGINQPIFWDGVNPARRSDPTKQEMPIGSTMAYIHGRMALASANGKNEIRIGDIVYGGSATTTANLLNFIETTYWAEGGYFSPAAQLGDITGLYPMPYLDTGTGQNELAALCTNGFALFNLSEPRATWLDIQVQRIGLIGQGNVSSHGFAGMNGELFYRRNDGIGAFRNARAEFQQTWRQTPISREVDYWLRYDRPDLMQFIPMASWQNMLFTGCSPQLARANSACAGAHRFCRGMVVYDAQSESTAGRDGMPVWHGAWSGIRPTAFAQGRIGTMERMFSFSYDRDGRNRLYEFTLTAGNDMFGDSRRKIFSFYDTGEFGAVEARTSKFMPKKATGGMLELSEIQGAVDFTVQFTPDGSPCRVNMDAGEPGCDCPEFEPCGINSQPGYARKNLEQIDPRICIPGTDLPAGVFRFCQMRVKMNGAMRVNRLQLRMDLQPDAMTAGCMTGDCAPIDCCPGEDDYDYHVASLGENTEVPAIPCPPEPDPTTYVSTRWATAYCSYSNTNFASRSAQGTSIISQADADSKALAAAQIAAQGALNCPECAPVQLAQFEQDTGTEDLSSYFAAGAYAGREENPWRLRDATVGQEIASGKVNASGTLQIVTDWGNPRGTLDPVTYIYTDNGGGIATFALQLGCTPNGVPEFPPDPTYGS